MPERSYPLTHKEQLRRRILQPPPPPDLYPPIADLPVSRSAVPTPITPRGCVFTKSCKLPDGIINYANPSGFVPLDSLKDYGDYALLGGREVDSSGALPLKKISGSALPVGLGALALASSSISTTAVATGGTVAAGLLTGIVALIWPSELGDSALYTEEQLRSLKQANSRVRLNIEQQADGTLKGYGFYTGNNADWQRIPVIQFQTRAAQQVAVFGEGLELIWTPAIDPADTLGIPALEAAPQAPTLWVYPPTEASNSILVNPIYPPEYQDFILVFPADSGVRPLYVVVSERKRLTNPDHDYLCAPTTEQITGFPGLRRAKKMTPKQGGAGLRDRWTDAKNRRFFEWDSAEEELEVYRTSDGSHLGAFDHVTGEQRKPPNKKRNIKKFM
ncbi:S-type pyocin domain-containing protein [Pseudomonas sp. 6D_7.1_Bac1]|uniref:S-type pyocin domain-containing protein n=1 Tax=Pseudomonas sp. 6D_7.1_Bac1 TaxID=2971615 RepID=UPI0021C9CCD9|nr:S-type pyocin domain-containing protein [Pseudomonas sp. 6D_7.1_Bac1]MCU1749346.1 S-type pyocin domain-containing protein [Pseudomonas sp. 6D_7.1_Bac1]